MGRWLHSVVGGGWLCRQLDALGCQGKRWGRLALYSWMLLVVRGGWFCGWWNASCIRSLGEAGSGWWDAWLLVVRGRLALWMMRRWLHALGSRGRLALWTVGCWLHSVVGGGWLWTVGYPWLSGEAGSVDDWMLASVVGGGWLCGQLDALGCRGRLALWMMVLSVVGGGWLCRQLNALGCRGRLALWMMGRWLHALGRWGRLAL